MPVDDIHHMVTDWAKIQTGFCSMCEDELGAYAILCDICHTAIHPHCAYENTCLLCQKSNNRINIRKQVQAAQEKQAKRMTKDSDGRLPPLELGDNVRVPVSKVDRGAADPSHLLGVVTDIVHGNYRVGTHVGTLKGTFARSMVEKCKQVFVSPQDVPETTLSVRAAVTAGSIATGQGHIHCNCKTGCFGGRCKCKKANRVCNSRCHPCVSGCKNHS